LGNGDQVVLPCDYCGKGFDEPRGQIEDWELVAGAKRGVITRVHSESTMQGESVEYYIDNRCFREAEMCDTEEAAAEQAVVIAERENDREMTQADRLKANKLKSFAWNAGYHLREAKKHRKDAEYHDKKAIVCQGRARE